MAEIFYDTDADMTALAGKKVAIIGYMPLTCAIAG